VLWKMKRSQDALASCEAALTVEPKDATTLNNRGAALQELKRFKDALASFDEALAVKPDFVGALWNRGHALFKLKRFDQAVTNFERALDIDPECAYAKGSLLSSRMNCCDWGRFASESGRLIADVRAGKRASEPWVLIGLSGSAGDQFRCSEIYVRDDSRSASAPIWKGERYRHDRIRVAYLSADFRDHPVCRLLAGVFEQHDRARFETIAVSFGPDGSSEMRSRVQSAFDRYIDVCKNNDRDVANLL